MTNTQPLYQDPRPLPANGPQPTPAHFYRRRPALLGLTAALAGALVVVAAVIGGGPPAPGNGSTGGRSADSGTAERVSGRLTPGDLDRALPNATRNASAPASGAPVSSGVRLTDSRGRVIAVPAANPVEVSR